MKRHSPTTSTGFSKGWKETFMSGDQEPWVFRGGLVADLQRLIPLDAANDLFLYKLPETSAVNLYTFRPYCFADEANLYSVCYRTLHDGDEFIERCPENLRSVLADRYLGPFLTLTPQFCMVIEDNHSEVVGYACAALDVKNFIRNLEQCWIPEMCLKYPLAILGQSPSEGNESPKDTANALPQMIRDCITYFHNFSEDYPTCVMNSHPSLLSCRILKPHIIEDETMCKRVITLLLAALRTHGTSFGTHVCVNKTDRFLYQFYAKLGFVEIYRDEYDPVLYMGRSF